MRTDFVNEVGKVLDIKRTDLIEKDFILHHIRGSVSAVFDVNSGGFGRSSANARDSKRHLDAYHITTRYLRLSTMPEDRRHSSLQKNENPETSKDGG